MIEQIINYAIENAEILCAFVGTTILEIIFLKRGNKDKAQKLKAKKTKLLNKLKKKHKATENKYIEEDKKIKKLEKEI